LCLSTLPYDGYLVLDHESLKLEPKEKRLAGTVNMFDVDLKEH
jgi:hypothetical protein